MTVRPVRLRLSRAKGFDLQAVSAAVNGLPVVNVARPSALGNPFVVGKNGTRAECVDLHKFLLAGWMCLSSDGIAAQKAHRVEVIKRQKSLAMTNLACWCDHKGPCHADTLLAVFNGWPLEMPHKAPGGPAGKAAGP